MAEWIGRRVKVIVGLAAGDLGVILARDEGRDGEVFDVVLESSGAILRRVRRGYLEALAVPGDVSGRAFPPAQSMALSHFAQGSAAAVDGVDALVAAAAESLSGRGRGAPSPREIVLDLGSAGDEALTLVPPLGDVDTDGLAAFIRRER